MTAPEPEQLHPTPPPQPDWNNIEWEDLLPRLLLRTAGQIDWLRWVGGRREPLPKNCNETTLIRCAIEQTLTRERPWDPHKQSLFEHLCGLIDEAVEQLIPAADPLETLPLKQVYQHLEELGLDTGELMKTIGIRTPRADAKPARVHNIRGPLLRSLRRPLAAWRSRLPDYQRRLSSLVPKRWPRSDVVTTTAIQLQRHAGDLRQRLAGMIRRDYRPFYKPLAVVALVLIGAAVALPILFSTRQPTTAPDELKLPQPEPASPVAQPPAPPVVIPSAPAAAEQPLVVDSIGRGATLGGVLARHGVELTTVDRIAAALAAADGIDPNRLRNSQRIELHFADDNSRVLQALHLPGGGYDIIVTRQADGGYRVQRQEHPLKQQLVQVEGRIENSFYGAAKAAGVPAGRLLGLLRFLETAIDFRRDVQPGDRFEIVYEDFIDDTERSVRKGEILSATLHLRQKNATYRISYAPDDDGGPYRLEQLPLDPTLGTP